MSTTPKNAVVWAEIPVTDLPKAMAFYEALTGQALSLDETGPNPLANFAVKDMNSGVAGHLYPGRPATEGQGPTIHLYIPDSVEAASTRCIAAGGKVLSQVIYIPPGRFAYAQDPDGNSIGLFEPKR